MLSQHRPLPLQVATGRRTIRLFPAGVHRTTWPSNFLDLSATQISPLTTHEKVVTHHILRIIKREPWEDQWVAQDQTIHFWVEKRCTASADMACMQVTTVQVEYW